MQGDIIEAFIVNTAASVTSECLCGSTCTTLVSPILVRPCVEVFNASDMCNWWSLRDLRRFLKRLRLLFCRFLVLFATIDTGEYLPHPEILPALPVAPDEENQAEENEEKDDADDDAGYGTGTNGGGQMAR